MQIIALVGLKGSGKTTASEFLAAAGWPTLDPTGGDALERIAHLLESGQKQLVLDGVSLESWQAVRQAYPETLFTIGIVAPKTLRHHRLKSAPDHNLSEAEILECDRIELSDLGVGTLLGAADTYLLNDSDRDALKHNLLALLDHPYKTPYN